MTVVIPTTGRESLHEAVESAARQTHTPKEILICSDGASLDSSQFNYLVEKYPKTEIRIIECKKTFGPAHPRNIGIQESKSSYIAFLDDDDLWLPEKIEKQIEFIRKSDSKFVCGNAVIFDSHGPIEDYLVSKQLQSLSPLNFIRSNPVITSTVLCSRELAMATGGFPENPEYAGIEDYLMWATMSYITRLYFLPTFETKYRKVSKESLSETRNNRKFNPAILCNLYVVTQVRNKRILNKRIPTLALFGLLTWSPSILKRWLFGLASGKLHKS